MLKADQKWTWRQKSNLLIVNSVVLLSKKKKKVLYYSFLLATWNTNGLFLFFKENTNGSVRQIKNTEEKIHKVDKIEVCSSLRDQTNQIIQRKILICAFRV